MPSVWFNFTGDHQFANPANWDDGLGPLQTGLAQFFDDYAGSSDDVYGVSGQFDEIDIDGYGGTLFFSGPVTSGSFLMRSGAISQPTSTTDLSVTGTFQWTGGILNSTPSNATVNIYGGGSITLPTAGTLTTGSTLNFDNLNPASGVVTTTITGAGALLLNGTSEDAIFVRADAKVEKVLQAGNHAGLKAAGTTTKTVTLEPKAEWGFIGNGSDEFGLLVANTGGKFFLGVPDLAVSQVTIKMTAGDANTPVYTQNHQDAKLQIMSGCVLDVTASKGVAVSNGFVWAVGNPDLAVDNQFAMVKGTFWMSGGNIGFPEQLLIDQKFVWLNFRVDGNANWSGGDFATGVDARANHGDDAHRWIITGTLTLLR